ncbi:MAG: hypothetical protein IJE25_05395 [Clostridia bacterium]|nr:hypothetical protein [Clostridia bacterium]
MQIVGQKVKHLTLGVGTIISYDGKEQNTNKYIKVEFDIKRGEYPFPNAFLKHLSAVDLEFDIFIKNELSKKMQPEIKPSQNIEKNNSKINIEQKNAFSPKHEKTLAVGRCYGTNSKVIYLNCCEWFGWDKSQKNNFGKQGTLLYAKGATPEKYSPWFVANHNLHKTQGGKWTNTIEGDFIHEEWHTPDSRLWEDKSIRVVFLKLNGEYKFYGLFEVHAVIQKENFKFTKIYKRIAMNYPS